MTIPRSGFIVLSIDDQDPLFNMLSTIKLFATSKKFKVDSLLFLLFVTYNQQH